MSFPLLYEPQVSDHAVVRWLELHGYPIERVREAILSDGRGDWLAAGAVAVQVPRLGLRLVANAGVVITIQQLGGDR